MIPIIEKIERFFVRLRKRTSNLPITVFYKYLWSQNRRLLIKTLLISYILPIVIELLPWYASRRKIGNYLRERRVKINHNMVTSQPFSSQLIIGYIGLTLLHAIIETANRHLMNRLALQNRLLIKRFVMERLLYSEIGGFYALKARDNIGPAELEYKINNSIGLTLNFFNEVIPAIFASFYAFVREGSDLFRNWDKIDFLLVLHPVLMGLTSKIIRTLRNRFMETKTMDASGRTSAQMSRMVCNAMEGLADIQVNNLQPAQLQILDQMIHEELAISEGFSTFLARTWSSISSRNVIDFVVEVFVAHKVMERRGIGNKEYRTMQLNIDRVIRLARRTYHSIRQARHTWKDQSKVTKVLNIPNFIHEDKKMLRIKPEEFKELRIDGVQFSYKSFTSGLDIDVPALDLQGVMVIEPGKRYALIGQNRSGKSTLNHILCKLYSPDAGEITVNGASYASISRTSLRSLLTYVSQRPFIFPGTIRDNILVGNPDASEEEVEAAAEAAGVFAFAEAAGIRYVPSNLNLASMHQYMAEGDETTDDEASGYESEGEEEGNDSFSMDNVEGDWSTMMEAQGVDNLALGPESIFAQDDMPEPSMNVSTDKFERLDFERRKRRRPHVYSLLKKKPLPLNLDLDGHPVVAGEPPISVKRKILKKMSDCALPYAFPRVYSDSSSDDEEDLAPRTPIIPHKSGAHSAHPILDQEIEARGQNVSGGFAQSIALARIFVRPETRVLILDEATSQMDAFKKREIIFPKLFEFTQKLGIALIIVTHDLASIQDVDRIFVLDQGRLVHQGSHKELIEQKATLYTTLLGY